MHARQLEEEILLHLNDNGIVFACVCIKGAHQKAYVKVKILNWTLKLYHLFVFPHVALFNACGYKNHVMGKRNPLQKQVRNVSSHSFIGFEFFVIVAISYEYLSV
uniref:Uncharacterized protein n=1 Tax=Glossina austeni TaxID=7395 RepID=A0A1A9VL69_GLOAU